MKYVCIQNDNIGQLCFYENTPESGTGTHKLYWHATHLQSKLPQQYLKDP